MFKTLRGFLVSQYNILSFIIVDVFVVFSFNLDQLSILIINTFWLLLFENTFIKTNNAYHRQICSSLSQLIIKINKYEYCLTKKKNF